jgi:hypothetical protein
MAFTRGYLNNQRLSAVGEGSCAEFVKWVGASDRQVWRRAQKAEGYSYTIVNGQVTFEDGKCTGALPGKVLRSYDMA